MAPTRLMFAVFILLTVHIHFAVAGPKKFEQWYPQFGEIFATLLQQNCSSQFDAYLAGKKNLTDLDWLIGQTKKVVLVQPVIECLLGSASSFVQFNMQSA